MTELFIDGYPVSLSVDFEIDYYMYNPFFTKKGEYTYDIDIDLRDRENAKVYKHIDRAHVGKRPTGRKAILIADSKVIVSGTEVILSIEDDKVKIQIAAGNSELNYLSAGNKTLRELDLGTIPEINATMAVWSLTKTYPEANFVCAPVVKEKGNYDISDYVNKTDVIYNELEWDTRNGYVFVSGTTFVPQPYLLYYVDKICEALGYKINENVLLQNKIYCKHIVVNGLATNQYNRILPKWTVDEFLSEIEKSYNVIFVVNQMTRKIRVLNVNNFYEQSETLYISSNQVLKNKEKKYDQDESLYLTYNNVSYKLPSGRWYKYQDVDEEILAKCNVVEVDNFSQINTVTYKGQYYIFHDKSTDLYFVYNILQGQATTYAHLDIINQLKGVVDEESGNNCELKIIPAEIYANNIWFSSKDFGGSKYYSGWIAGAIPVVANVASSETQENLYEEIENGLLQDETESSNIFIAIYLGSTPYMYYFTYQNVEIAQPVLDKMRYPQCVVYPYFIHYNRAGAQRKLIKLAPDDHTLAILGRYGRFNQLYKNNFYVNTEEEVVRNFLTDKILNQMNLFVIDNKKYYCKVLHYKIRSEGLSKEVEGTFYPM